MDKKLLKRLCYIVAIVLIVSLIVIYSTIDFENIKKISLFQPKFILLALLSLAMGLFLDGTRLVHLIRVVGEKTTTYETVKVVFSNYFLALLTPGATGGAVAQVMFLKKAEVPISKATVVVLVRTMLSISFLVLVLPVVLGFDRTVTAWISEKTLGIIVLILIALYICLIGLLQTTYPEKWLVFFLRNINHDIRRRIYKFYKEMKITSQIFIGNPISMIRVFFESGLSLLFIYATVPILFYGLDSSIHVGQVMCRMIVLNLILYFTPTPGGVGVAEAGFVMLFSGMLPVGTVGIMAIAWRVLVEYLPFVIGGFFCIKTFGADVLTKIAGKK